MIDSQILYRLGLGNVFMKNDLAWGTATWQFNDGYSAAQFIDAVTEAGLEIVTATPTPSGMLVVLRAAPVYAPLSLSGSNAAGAAHV